MDLERAEWVFSHEAFRMKMLEAKKSGIPIQPPARPVFENPESLELLGGLQFHHHRDSLTLFDFPPSENLSEA